MSQIFSRTLGRSDRETNPRLLLGTSGSYPGHLGGTLPHVSRMHQEGDTVGHLDRLNEICQSMEAVGEAMDEPRRMTVLLGRLPADYPR